MTRTVLITGGAGFIGSNLAARLVAGGDRVRVLDDLSIGQAAYLDGVAARARRRLAGRPGHGPGRGRAASTRSSTSRPGQGSTIRSATRSGRSRRTWRGRSACSTPPARQGFGASCSPRRMPRPATTRHRATRRTCRSRARRTAPRSSPSRATVGAYAATYGMAACSLRFSNAYGPRSLHKRSVVAAWLRAAIGGEPIVIHGDGRQTRDFIHVDDLASAVVAALDAPRRRPSRASCSRPGPGSRRASRSSRRRSAARSDDRSRCDMDRRGPGMSRATSRASTRLRRCSDIRAAVTLADGLARTATWYRRALDDPELATVRGHSASGSE